MKSISIAKPGQGCINEDFALANEHVLAISDGAGGGGIYADRWANYLVKNLPITPICSFDELDSWIDRIWEPFYNDCEQLAKVEGGMVLNKFYDEGSFATLTAIWDEGNLARWITYGDSVAFCYSPSTGELQHSFTLLSDFNKPPYLINYKDELRKEGFRCGTFKTRKDDILFCASDALSHYILMMYKLANCSEFSEELLLAEKSGSKESTFIKNATSLSITFPDVLNKLINCKSKYLFERHLVKLYRNKLIALDDYSFAYKISK